MSLSRFDHHPPPHPYSERELAFIDRLLAAPLVMVWRDGGLYLTTPFDMPEKEKETEDEPNACPPQLV